MPGEHPIESIPAYLLGALDYVESSTIQAHIAVCPSCRAEADSFSRTLHWLPYASAPMSPPARVKRQLMARISASQQQRDPAPLIASAATSAARRGAASRWIAAAAIACAMGVGGLAIEARQRADALGAQIAQRDARIKDVEGRLASTSGALEEKQRTSQQELDALRSQVITSEAERQQRDTKIAALSAQIVALDRETTHNDLVLAFVAAPQTVSKPIGATPLGSGSSAQIYMQPGHNDVIVLMAGLPPAAPGSVYQLWVADSGGAIPLGDLVISGGGITEIIGKAPKPMDNYAAVMVTVETIGSSTPSDRVVFQDNL